MINNTQMKATRALAALVCRLNKTNPEMEAVATITPTGMTVEYWEYPDEGEDFAPFRASRGWLFNEGGWSANLRNYADIRYWLGDTPNQPPLLNHPLKGG